MGVRRGGQEGALDPPWPTKIVCFLHFFDENSIFLGVFGANSMFLLPPPVCDSVLFSNTPTLGKYVLN